MILSVVFLCVWVFKLWAASDIRTILLASLAVFLFGLLDDAKGLSPVWKFGGQVLAVLLVMLPGVYVRFLPHPVLNFVITFVWIIGITNAFNLVDSMDGLAVGLAGLCAAFFMLVTLETNQGALAILSAIVLGTSIGLFYYNAFPARLFLGDAGAQWLGFVLATLAIAYTPPQLPQLSSWFVPILVLSVPIFDTTLVTVSRLRRGIPIYKANRDHTYHRLASFGMGDTRAVISMHIAAVLSGCLAFVALSLSPLWANMIFAGCVVLGVIALIYLEVRWDGAIHLQDEK